MLQNKMFRCIPLLCVFKVCSVIKMANKLCECTYFLTFINLQKEKRVIIMNQKKVTLRGELALLIVILINSMGVVLMLRSGSGIFRYFQRPLRIFPCISDFDPWHLDLYFPGTSCFKPDDLKKTLCSQLPI